MHKISCVCSKCKLQFVCIRSRKAADICFYSTTFCSEKNETIFEVRTFAGSRDRAKKIVDNWNKNASKIYPKILDLLLED